LSSSKNLTLPVGMETSFVNPSSYFTREMARMAKVS